MAGQHLDRWHSPFGRLDSLAILIECKTRGELVRDRQIEIAFQHQVRLLTFS